MAERRQINLLLCGLLGPGNGDMTSAKTIIIPIENRRGCKRSGSGGYRPMIELISLLDNRRSLAIDRFDKCL